MCENCYIENDSPTIVNNKTKKAAELINAIYEQDDCGVGGYAHIVVDDWNLDDGCIDFCIKASREREYSGISNESADICLSAMMYLKTLSEEERYSAMAIHSGFLEI